MMTAPTGPATVLMPAAVPAVIPVASAAATTATSLTSSNESEDAKSECETNHVPFLSPTQDGDLVFRDLQPFREETLQPLTHCQL
jgi:hypothetical protein